VIGEDSSDPIGRSVSEIYEALSVRKSRHHMALTVLDKGKAKAIHETSESDGSSSFSSSGSDSGSASESEDEVTPEYLEALLGKARENAAARRTTRQSDNATHEEDMIKLPGSTNEQVTSRATPRLLS
jgi:rhamnogalacturonyl hydrolase YesR